MTTIPHKTKIKIVEKFIKPENLSGEKNIWGRELKMLNKFIKSYPDEAFWNQVNLNFKLNSFAWFVKEGAGKLEEEWRLYKLQKIQETQLDNTVKKEKIEEIDNTILVQKPNVFGWTDK